MSEQQEASQTNTEEAKTDDVASKLYDADSEQAKEGETQQEEKEEAKESNEVKEGKQEDEEISYDLKLDGDSKLKQEDLDGIVEFSKKHGLSNDVATELLKEKDSIVNGFLNQLKSNHEKQVNEWLETSKNDSEIGGENLKETAELAKRAIEQFGSDSLLDLLDQSGYGNHPEVLRIFSKVGKLIQDDKIIMPGKSGVQRSKADILYGN